MAVTKHFGIDAANRLNQIRLQGTGASGDEAVHENISLTAGKRFRGVPNP